MRKKAEDIKVNIIQGLCFTIVTGILSFLVNKVFSDYLGQESLGILRLFSQLIAYMSLAELGLAAAAQSLLYQHFKLNDKLAISNVVFTLRYFYSRISIAVLAIGLTLNFLLPFIIGEAGSVVYICWTLYVTSLSISYFSARYVIVMTSDQRFGLVQVIRNTCKIVLSVVQVISLIFYQSFTLFVFLVIVSSVIELYLIRKYYFRLYRKTYESGNEKVKTVIDKTKQLFIHNFAGVLVFNTDYIIIARFVDLSTIAIYSSYLLVLRFIELVVTNITNVIRPKLGSIFVNSTRKERLALFYKSHIFVVYIATNFVFILNNVLRDFVIIWLDESYMISDLTLSLILFNFYCFIIRKPIDLFKEVSGYFKDVHLPIIEGLINLIFSLFLVQIYGLNGVIMGTAISNLVVILILKPYVVFNYVFNSSFLNYIILLCKSTMMSFFCLVILTLSNTYSSLNILGLLMLVIQSFIVVTPVFLMNKSFRRPVFRFISTLGSK